MQTFHAILKSPVSVLSFEDNLQYKYDGKED